MPEPPRVATRVWYLELGDLRPAREPPPEVRIELAQVPLGALNRFFYVEIGRDLHWIDRLPWGQARWQALAEQVETWVAYDRGTPAGVAELRRVAPDRVELEIFGVLAPFQGRGLGGALLTRAARRARELAPRVTVNTCELDGPHARRNYEQRGFRLVREEIAMRGRKDLL